MTDIKYDIRDWAPDHEKMGKGITLTEEEAARLKELLWYKHRYKANSMEAFYYLDENKVKNGDFTLLEYDIEEFLNPNYKTLELM